MVDLFQRTGLEQDTGQLRERWDQEDAEYASATASFTTSAGTILTVTSGKTLYVKYLSFQCSNGTVTNNTLTDGSGGATKIYLQSIANDGLVWIELKTPLKFTTSVYQNSASSIWKFTVIGWEE